MKEFLSGKNEGENAVVDSILSNRKLITFDEFKALGYKFIDYDSDLPEVSHCRLDYGRKALVITTDLRYDVFYTFVINTNGDSKESETTYLYKAAQRLMQETARESGRDMEYHLNTKSKVMRDWAQNQGNEIFGWDDSDTYDVPATASKPATTAFSAIKKFPGKV